MKSKLVTVTPEMAREMLKFNTHNRNVRQSHVDYLASEIANGRWQVTGDTIKIAPDGTVIDGQHRLLAVVQANAEISTLVAYEIPLSAQTLVDTGAGRKISDQLHLADGLHNANHVCGAAKAIVSLCCYYQNVKISPDIARLVYSEFKQEIDFCIEQLRQFRPGMRAWVIGTLAFAMSADRKAEAFITQFGSGEGLQKGSPAKAARDWLTNGNGLALTAHYKRAAIEGLLNAAFNGVVGGSITSIKRGAQGVDYFTGKKRKTVGMIREELRQQISVE